MKISLITLLFYFASSVAMAYPIGAPLPKLLRTEQQLYLTSTEAYNMANNDDNVIMIDLRPRYERLATGVPTTVTFKIPAFVRKGQDLLVKDNFISNVRSKLQEINANTNNRIILISTDARDSAMAANHMYHAGFTAVYHVIDGMLGFYRDIPESYNLPKGWKLEKLPIDIESMIRQ